MLFYVFTPSYQERNNNNKLCRNRLDAVDLLTLRGLSSSLDKKMHTNNLIIINKISGRKAFLK